jgi:hypothetical protein
MRIALARNDLGSGRFSGKISTYTGQLTERRLSLKEIRQSISESTKPNSAAAYFGPLVCTFFCTVVVFFISARIYFNHLLRLNPGLHGQVNIHIEGVSPEIQSRLSNETNRAHVKWEKKFWLNRRYSSGKDGAKLDILADPQLFSEAFPGYPQEMREDHLLWSKYFTRVFDFNEWLPSLVDKKEYFVHMSSLGCADIFERYGADTIVFGNSETFVTLVPKVLADAFPGANDRVLFCTRNAMSTRLIEKIARHLVSVSGGKKVPRIVLGFSQNWVYRINEKSNDVKGEERDFDHFTGSENVLKRWIWFKPRDFFNVPSWEELEPLLLGDLRHSNESAGQLKLPTFESWGIQFASADLPSIQGIVQSSLPFYEPKRGSMGGGGCSGLENPATSLESMFSALQDLGQHIYVFKTPVTKIAENVVAPCGHDFADKLLAEKKGPGFYVKFEKSQDYGLGWKDFAIPGSTSDDMWLDLNHLNYTAASKVSHAIANWIRNTETKNRNRT